MKKSLRNLLIFLGIAVALGAVYFLFFNNKGTAQTASTSSLSSSARTSAAQPLNASETNTTGSTLLALLGRVTGLTLNDDIFSNPSFATLQDISITLPAVDVRGRRNPFAPSGATATTTPASTTTSTPATTGTNSQ